MLPSRRWRGRLGSIRRAVLDVSQPRNAVLNTISRKSCTKLAIALIAATTLALSPVSRAGSSGASSFFYDVATLVAANILSDVIVDYMSAPSSPPSVVAGSSQDIQRIRNIIQGILDQNTPLEERVSYYARQVDYFDAGTVDHAYIFEDRKRFEQRWPYRRYDLLSVDETAIDPAGKWATARYTIAYEVKRAGRTSTGKAKVALVLGSFDGQPRIHAIKEWVRRD
jgi:hypothetical protein